MKTFLTLAAICGALASASAADTVQAPKMTGTELRDDLVISTSDSAQSSSGASAILWSLLILVAIAAATGGGSGGGHIHTGY